jgi:four helix bundle protein
MRTLDHEKLHVYQVALDFLALSDGLISAMPRGHAYLADQLYRASSSVCLNIAEGAGEFSPLDKSRFYRMARRSASECGAILDVVGRLRLAPPDQIAPGRDLLIQIVAMLTAMVRRRTERVGAGP